ncbi:hypothetical protein SAMN05216267_1002146 [Actinacidiphila rubida]|uniref:Uncharacterized protein n=2 Tax=Actinacidiphila rubida TaxID=310780 RepID=A0A1H8EDH8_9ACTN|nr:hypothetical protein SAMN05216267_1002146 [Actinacidiphila rubida]
MNGAERREFRSVLRRIAEEEPDDAPYIEDLPRLLGW